MTVHPPIINKFSTLLTQRAWKIWKKIPFCLVFSIIFCNFVAWKGEGRKSSECHRSNPNYSPFKTFKLWTRLLRRSFKWSVTSSPSSWVLQVEPWCKHQGHGKPERLQNFPVRLCGIAHCEQYRIGGVSGSRDWWRSKWAALLRGAVVPTRRINLRTRPVHQNH